jgi:hypothetical protein
LDCYSQRVWKGQIGYTLLYITCSIPTYYHSLDTTTFFPTQYAFLCFVSQRPTTNNTIIYVYRRRAKDLDYQHGNNQHYFTRCAMSYAPTTTKGAIMKVYPPILTANIVLNQKIWCAFIYNCTFV